METTPQTTQTAAQRKAINAQAAYYDSDECPVAGLSKFSVMPATNWDSAYPSDAVAVDFTYRYDDGARGIETTIFAADGSVLSSQDFG